MHYSVKFVLLLATVIALGALITFVKNRMARRTVRNWSGKGVQADLTAAEAALLSSMHPSAIVAVFLAELETAGKAERRGDSPPRAEWTGPDPAGRAERAMKDALEGGEFSAEGVLAVLEALYESTDTKLAGCSGRATVVFYRSLVRLMWKQTAEGAPDDGLLPALPWYLLRNPTPGDWEHLGDARVETEIKGWQRTVQRYRDSLVPLNVYLEALKDSKVGFFRYRRDLRKYLESSRLTGYHPLLDHGPIPASHETPGEGGGSDS